MGLLKRDTSHLNQDTSRTLANATTSCAGCGAKIPITDVLCNGCD